MDDATIYAPATGAGPAGVAVIRVSGRGASDAVATLTRRGVPTARKLVRREIRAASGGDRLDVGLVAWFPGPESFTGEDVAEFHVHGGAAVVAGVLGALGDVADLRLAAPGEFTRRAFENGKMDLTAAEALADLVAARSEAQRRQALNQMRGALATLYDGWRGRLIQCLGRLEAEVDFADEDLPGGLRETALAEVGQVLADIRVHLADRRRGERLRDGFRVAILGRPNVGKSTLLNRLAGREVAIVSAISGTTRDVLEVHLDLGGLPVTLCDTAGLRAARDEIEAEGVRRARREAERAALRVVVYEAGGCGDQGALGLNGGEGATIRVWNKADLAAEGSERGVQLWVSAKTGAGVDALLSRIEERVRGDFGGFEAPALTRARHREALVGCAEALARAREVGEIELQAEDVRVAVRALGRVTGRVDVEDVLDGIFAEFCIGK